MKERSTLIVACDIETVLVDQKHIVICYGVYLNEQKKNCESLKKDSKDNTYCEENGNKLIDNMIDYCFDMNVENNRYIFYFHNLSRFDSNFIFASVSYRKNIKTEILCRNNIVYKIVLKAGNKKIEFRDSLHVCPMNLNLMAKTFITKEKIQYNQSFENHQYDDKAIVKLKEYCMSNCLLLKESLEKYFDTLYTFFKVDVKEMLSISSISHKIFDRLYSKHDIKKISGNKESFVRQSYKGGKVEVYIPKLINGYHYDVNSLYTYIMMNSCIPVGDGEWIDNYKNEFGFVLCKIKTIKDNIKRPFLTIMMKDIGLISPIGEWVGVYHTNEIEYAKKELDYYHIDILKCLKFEKRKCFKEYMEKLHSIRLKYEKGTPMNFLTKLLPNSFYGKFGMNPKCTKTEILDVHRLTEYIKKFKILSADKLNEKIIIKYEDEFDDDIMKTLKGKFISEDEYREGIERNLTLYKKSKVHVASTITANARIYMEKLMNECENVYYTDTDSIFTDKPISQEFVSNIEIGKLKLEDEIQLGYFVAPKVYILKNKEGNEKKKFKGIKIDNIIEEDYLKMYQGFSIKKTYTESFDVNIKTKTIHENIKTKKFMGFNKKSHKIYKENEWFENKPIKLKIENGINLVVIED